MKNHRFYTLTIILLMATTQLFAGTVEMQRAKALGAKFVEANFMRNTQLEWVYTGITPSGRPSFHVFNGTSGGFVIVSACDLTSPILGYSESGSFNTGNIPDGLAYFLDGYGQSVDFAEESLKGADFVIAQEWSNLELCGKTQTAKPAFVQPLIATHWDQDCYYNACCPKDDAGPCGNVYAGCVATSMAQMMKYWNYPEHGTGSHSYDSYAYGILSADFGATTYYWDEMPESLHDNELYVSTLIFHCGVSVDMYYGAMASGALQQNIPLRYRPISVMAPRIVFTAMIIHTMNGSPRCMKPSIARRPSFMRAKTATRVMPSFATDTTTTVFSISTGAGAANSTAISASTTCTPITNIGPWRKR